MTSRGFPLARPLVLGDVLPRGPQPATWELDLNVALPVVGHPALAHPEADGLLGHS